MTRPFGAVLEAIDGVEGWLSRGQAARLYAAAARCPAGGMVVEIGSFRGRSTIVLAAAAAPGVRVTAIDPHAGTDRGPQEISGYAAAADTDHVRFGENLTAAGVADRVDHLRAFSHDTIGQVGAIDVLYVDGAHRYRPARADLVGYGAKVTEHGVLLIHDAFSSVGVTTAIIRELFLGRRFRYVGRTASLVEYRADLPSGLRARTHNVLRQAAQLPWFARNLGVKAFLAAGGGRLLRRAGRRVPQWPY